jgi:hypothetical protein
VQPSKTHGNAPISENVDVRATQGLGLRTIAAKMFALGSSFLVSFRRIGASGDGVASLMRIFISVRSFGDLMERAGKKGVLM